MILRALLFGAAAGAISGCGFSPLYAETSMNGAASELALVQLSPIIGPADVSPILEDALRETMPSLGDVTPQYTLDLKLKDQRRSIAVTRSAETTRFNYYLVANYTLRERTTGTVVRRNALNTVVSYGIVSEQYASRIGREDAVRRAALELSRRIELDVALFLKGQAPAESDISLGEVVDADVVDPGQLGDADDR
jgi:LPS-assembly lipoprotein